MPLIVVYNPVCGDRTAKVFFQDHVLPFLAVQGKQVDRLVETEHPGHASKVVSEFVESHSKEPIISVVLGSGDGTLHELVDGLYFKKDSVPRICIALVPCGTANALYSSLFPAPSAGSIRGAEYRLQSLRSFISGKPGTALCLAVTRLKPSSEDMSKTVLSAVVASTSLHAAILHYSEGLRQEYPGLERFKMAAEQNSTKWFKARACLLPAPSKTTPEIYDPKSKTFIPASQNEGAVELDGPFAYFLSTLNVDRLEPTFFITPLARSIAPPPNTCDVVVVRPLRDPSVSSDSATAREQFVPKTWAAMTGAYQEGAHVDLRYDSKGQLTGDGDGEGVSVVEYYRCGGWEWHPEPEDEDAHLVCSDGAINRLERNGWAECRVSTLEKDRTSFEIYA